MKKGLFFLFLTIVLSSSCKKETEVVDNCHRPEILSSFCAIESDTTTAYQLLVGKWHLRYVSKVYAHASGQSSESYCFVDSLNYLEFLPDRTINIFGNQYPSKTIPCELIYDDSINSWGLHNKIKILDTTSYGSFSLEMIVKVCEKELVIEKFRGFEMRYSTFVKE